jgi:hypothetical protein
MRKAKVNKKKGITPSHAQDLLGGAGRAFCASRVTASKVVVVILWGWGWDVYTNGLHPAFGDECLGCGKLIGAGGNR